NRLLPMAASAANMQQELPYWLKRQPARPPLSAASEPPVLPPRLLRVAIISFLVIASFFIIFPIGFILGIIVITTRCCQNLRQIETGAVLLGCFDRSHEGVDHLRDRLCLARRDLALGERCGDRVRRLRDVAGRQPAAISRERALDRWQTE